MTATATSTYVPDALDTLRDSIALHLGATRSAKTSRIYLAALGADRPPQGQSADGTWVEKAEMSAVFG